MHDDLQEYEDQIKALHDEVQRRGIIIAAMSAYLDDDEMNIIATTYREISAQEEGDET